MTPKRGKNGRFVATEPTKYCSVGERRLYAVSVCVCVCVCVCMDVCIEIYIYIYMHVCVYVCARVCIECTHNVQSPTNCCMQHLLDGRGMYAEYEKHSMANGQDHYSPEKFRQGINKVLAACREVLDDEVCALHEHLKACDYWIKGFCGADGSWSKPTPAPHGLFCVRNLGGETKGGILGYKLFSTKDLTNPYLGTSDSMEVIGALSVFSKLAMLGYASKELKIVCDGDTHCGKVCEAFFTSTINLDCSNHINKNLGKCVCRIGPTRPKGCVCEHRRRGHNWRKPCGCVNSSVMVKYLKACNMKLMIKAGERKDPEWYRRWLNALQECIFDDKHEDCAHHDDHGNHDTYQTPDGISDHRLTHTHSHTHTHTHTCIP